MEAGFSGDRLRWRQASVGTGCDGGWLQWGQAAMEAGFSGDRLRWRLASVGTGCDGGWLQWGQAAMEAGFSGDRLRWRLAAMEAGYEATDGSLSFQLDKSLYQIFRFARVWSEGNS